MKSQFQQQPTLPKATSPFNHVTLKYFPNETNTRHVALAGQSGGALAVVLDFFVTFFIKKKSKEENDMQIPISPINYSGIKSYT